MMCSLYKYLKPNKLYGNPTFLRVIPVALS